MCPHPDTTFQAEKPSSTESLIHVSDPNHAANLIPSLCAEFYKLGWVTGTGGGVSIRQAGSHTQPNTDSSVPTSPDDLIYIAPSGVQKERMRPDDLFVIRVNKNKATTAGEKTDSTTTEIEYIHRPQGLKPSSCTPLFLQAFERRGAAACIHTHSQWAVLVSLMVERDMKGLERINMTSLSSALPPTPVKLDQVDVSSKRWDTTPGPDAVLSRPFRISRLEQIKGIPCAQFSTTWNSRLPSSSEAKDEKLPHHSYYSTLSIPVIENTANEVDLEASLTAAMEAYPDTCAVLVLRHGLYVWGQSWVAAKTTAESLDYIFRLAVEMRRDGFSWV